MKLKKVTFKKDLLIDTVFAALIVVNVPKLINNYFPTLFGTSTNNYIEAIIGGASAYLVGMLTGKADIANVGIALAAAGIANDFISPMVVGTGSKPLPVIGDYVQLSGSQRLANYNNQIDSMNYNQYNGAY